LAHTASPGRVTAWPALALAGFAAVAAGPALAAPPPLTATAIGNAANPNGVQTNLGLLGNLERTNFLLGDLFGLRSFLSRYGISLAIQETSEVLGNATGGQRRGAAYDGLTQAILQLDTQRAFGWYGGLVNISALQIHGRNLSSDNLLSLQTASGIEADRATRLWEAWFDQKLDTEGKYDIKIGQQSVDQDFITSPNGAYFLNTMMGWPMLPSADLPGGGPAYPLSTPGIRLHARLLPQLTLLAGIFNGSPAAKPSADAQAENASGLDFPLNGGTFDLVELQWAYPALGGMEMPGEGAPLGHIYKIGLWYNSESFADQRIGTDGRPLANPLGNGLPLQHRGDYAIYATADQMIWRKTSDPNRSISVFGRVMGTPQGDRNLIDFSANGGIVLHEPFTYRSEDTAGLGFGYAHLSNAVTEYDRDVAFYTHQANPAAFTAIRHAETFVELTYQYQVHPWWQIQPDLQYVFNPGGGIVDPLHPAQRVGDEFVLGLRTNILF
jgi:porin